MAAPARQARAWRTSSRSTSNGECVEVALGAPVVGLRDSKDRQGPELSFGSAAWRTFLDAVKSGSFDRP